MSKQNADNAGQADHLMQEANQVVTQADESMSSAAMKLPKRNKSEKKYNFNL